jgi:hypothetical protein
VIKQSPSPPDVSSTTAINIAKQKPQTERKIVVVLDSIASNPGVLMPWQEMVQICREEGAWSVVDAAHSIGQEVGIDLGKADPDFWVSVGFSIHRNWCKPDGCSRTAISGCIPNAQLRFFMCLEGQNFFTSWACVREDLWCYLFHRQESALDQIDNANFALLRNSIKWEAAELPRTVRMYVAFVVVEKW